MDDFSVRSINKTMIMFGVRALWLTTRNFPPGEHLHVFKCERMGPQPVATPNNCTKILHVGSNEITRDDDDI